MADYGYLLLYVFIFNREEDESAGIVLEDGLLALLLLDGKVG